VNLVFALGSLLVDLLPDTVDVANLVGKKELVRQAAHEVLNLDVTSLPKDLDPLLDLVLLF
jgi:hypothetical protein